MKKSSKSSSKKRDRNSPEDSKAKRSKISSSNSHGKEKSKEETKSVPRKTRWQAEDKQDVNKNVPTSDPSTKNKLEKSGPPIRISDYLHDREKIVELLFQTVTGAALQELIPDYLKKHPKDELKKLCMEQIKKMTDDVILEIIAGKVDSSNKEEKSAEKEEILKPEEPNIPKKIDEEKKEDDEKHDPEKKLETSKIAAAEILTDEAIERKAEKNETLVEENQIPLVIKDEVAKDLILPERDAELLELEMRARAIRSLLKAKSQSTNEEEDVVPPEED